MRSIPAHICLTFNLVDSTHELAGRMAERVRLAHGTVIRADQQIAGKGRMGSSWESDTGMNLLLSVFCIPDPLEASGGFLLYAASSLAISDCLAFHDLRQSRFKWPNDLLYSDKKVCGILIKTSIRGNRVSDAIVSIGLNVNQTRFDNVSIPAASMATLAGNVFEPREVESKLMEKLHLRWSLLEKDPQLIIDMYNDRLWKIGEDATISDEGGGKTVQIEGVERDGRLRGTLAGESESRNFRYNEWKLKWPE